MFTLYGADFCQQETNTLFPTKISVVDEESLRTACMRDYSGCRFKDSRRKNANFLSSDCVILDVDNTHSDKPVEWLTPENIAVCFPNVTYAVHFSRNHMLEKKGKAARPKFHVFFPVKSVTDPSEYAALKKRALSLCPCFDEAAMDTGRAFFGTESPEVKIFEGTKLLSDLSDADAPDSAPSQPLSDAAFEIDVPKTDAKGPKLKELTRTVDRIPEGCRNSSMFKFACIALSVYDDEEAAHERFMNESLKCSPPLSESELDSIWTSSKKHVKSDGEKTSYRPGDFTDVGQAQLFARFFRDRLRHSAKTCFLFYDNGCWTEDDSMAHKLSQDLTDNQMAEANVLLDQALVFLKTRGLHRYLDSRGRLKVSFSLSDDDKRLCDFYSDAKAYSDYALRRRSTAAVAATLNEAKPLVEIDVNCLDADPYLLNTPAGVFDLRLGMDGFREAKPEDFCTRQTSVSPSDKGKEVFLAAIEKTFCGDSELIEHVQRVCGLTLIGKVKQEALFIAYGTGRNGKSTFWETLSKVLGSYSGRVFSEMLLKSSKASFKNDLAQIRGKRLIILAELSEGASLNDAALKKLASADEIHAEKKYMDSFEFYPTHTPVLFTNVLPEVSSLGDGVWRRIHPIPFNACFTGKDDIKDYGEFLFDNAGEYFLKWCIEGAKKIIDAEFHFEVPECITEALSAYRSDSDPLAGFIEEKCDVGKGFSESSSTLYSVYRSYCYDNGESPVSTRVFYEWLKSKNFVRSTFERKQRINGLKLCEASDSVFG